MEGKQKPRVWWVLPADKSPDRTGIVIDAPPEVWQHPVLGDRINRQYWKDFVKVIEVVPEVLDVPCD